METIADGITIYHGDYRDAGVFSCDHVITDPPYEDELHNAMGRDPDRFRNDGGSISSKLGFDSINSQRTAISRDIVEVSAGWALVFSLAEGVRAWRDDLQAAGAKWDTTLAWIKPDSRPRFNGQGASRGFECICTVWCGHGYRSWNGGGKRGLYTHLTNGTSRHGFHPTEKPLGLMCELLIDYTKPGDLVFDPFMGSGTTGLACIRLGRRFAGCEIDPDYYQVAKSRMAEALLQTDMFVPVPEKFKQGRLL